MKPSVSCEDANSARRGKHDEGNIDIAENRKFIGFLYKAISSLGESDLPVCCVLDFLDLKLHSTHYNLCSRIFLETMLNIYRAKFSNHAFTQHIYIRGRGSDCNMKEARICI